MQQLLIATLALSLLGCGATPGPYDETHTGTLEEDDTRIPDDDSAFDDYTFEAAEGSTITIEMQSAAFRPYVWLFAPSRQVMVQQVALSEDQVAVTRTAPETGTYTVRANSADGTGRGAYTIHITAGPAAAPAPNPD